MAIAEGDVNFWHDFTDGSGSTVSDEVGSNDITLVASPTWGTSGVPSGLTGYVDFNGTTQYGTFATDVVDSSNGKTIAAWIRLDVSDMGFIVSNRGTNSDYIQMNTATNSNYLSECIIKNSGTTFYAANTGTADVGGWNHVAMAWDGTSGSELWINGVSVASNGSGTGGVGSNGTALHLADRGRSNSGDRFNGAIAQVNFFDKALSTAEVGELYNSGDGTTYSNLFSGGGAPANNANFFGGGV